MPGNYRYEEERYRGQRGMTRRGGFNERGRDDDELPETERFGSGPDYGREWGGRGSEGREWGGRGSEGREWGGRGGEGLGRGMQADGWSGEPDEMRWGRQQGFYGSPEYGGYTSSQRSQADYQSQVGKGPKGWRRSDERIAEDVNEALARHPEIDATDIEVNVQSCEVILAGDVTDRRTKRLAEDVAERVFGVRDVQNHIRVKPSAERASFGSFSERDVTPVPDREGRITDVQESQTRREQGTTRGNR